MTNVWLIWSADGLQYYTNNHYKMGFSNLPTLLTQISGSHDTQPNLCEPPNMTKCSELQVYKVHKALVKHEPLLRWHWKLYWLKHKCMCHIRRTTGKRSWITTAHTGLCKSAFQGRLSSCFSSHGILTCINMTRYTTSNLQKSSNCIFVSHQHIWLHLKLFFCVCYGWKWQ